MLLDQIAEKAYSERIREYLLLEDKLTLDKAIQIANWIVQVRQILQNALLQTKYANHVERGQKHEVREVVIPELTVLFLQDAVPVQRKIMCTVELGTSPDMQPLEMIVDNGSSVSILPAHVYKNLFSDIQSETQIRTDSQGDSSSASRCSFSSTCHDSPASTYHGLCEKLCAEMMWNQYNRNWGGCSLLPEMLFLLS